MTTRFIQCGLCKYLILDGKQRCKAFPKKIPDDILTGKFKHVKKHPDQDNDIVFEKRKD